MEGSRTTSTLEMSRRKSSLNARYTWTEGGNVPSAKVTTWSQAMFFFHAASLGYRKILFVLRDFSQKRIETLGEYYIRTNHHLIPKDVDIWEYDEKLETAKKIK